MGSRRVDSSGYRHPTRLMEMRENEGYPIQTPRSRYN